MALPAVIAPIVAKLISSGFNVLAGAVAAKGQDVIEEKLGIDLSAALGTEEGRIKLRQMEIDHEEFLITSAMERDKMDFENTANARDMNARIQEAIAASALAKNAAYYIDFLIVVGTLVLAYLIFFVGIPEANKELAYTAFGGLMAQVVTILNFHRGSSAGSKASGDAVRDALSRSMK